MMTSGSKLSEKINDLFLLTLSDLETTLISQVIKLNNYPQKLIEEVQLSINDFKQKMFSSLIQLIQLVSQCGQQNKDVKSIADALEQQVVKYKQTHLLFQMKGMVNTKIKALLETLNYSQSSNQKKQEIMKQVQLLTESLQKIETTLNHSTCHSPQTQPAYITPLPRRQQQQFSHSQDGLTPILSEEAEKKAKVQFITPDQNQVLFGINNFPQEHYNTQFQHTPQSNFQPHFSLENSVLMNKTLNSFNNENHEPQQKDNEFNDHLKNDNFRELMQNAFQNEHLQKTFFENQLPQFGGQFSDGLSSNRVNPRTPYQNQFMTQCLESIPVYDQKIETEPDLIQQTDEDYEESPKQRSELFQAIKQENIQKITITSSKSAIQRRVSTQSLSQLPRPNIQGDSPCQHSTYRQINSTNAKKQVQRKNSQIESVNLQNRFNQVGSKIKNKTTRENDKENSSLNKIMNKKPIPSTVIVKKQIIVLKKSKSNGVVKPVVKLK